MSSTAPPRGRIGAVLVGTIDVASSCGAFTKTVDTHREARKLARAHILTCDYDGCAVAITQAVWSDRRAVLDPPPELTLEEIAEAGRGRAHVVGRLPTWECSCGERLHLAYEVVAHEKRGHVTNAGIGLP